jgi:hypothetical protein
VVLHEVVLHIRSEDADLGTASSSAVAQPAPRRSRYPQLISAEHAASCRANADHAGVMRIRNKSKAVDGGEVMFAADCCRGGPTGSTICA